MRRHSPPTSPSSPSIHEDTPAPSLTDRIVAALADRIVRGELPPGTRLRQDHVARDFGASHVPVREAFRRLEAQGLVVSQPRRGVSVPALDAQGVEELVLMREALEIAALREAMRREPNRALQKAKGLLDQEERARDVLALEETNQAFHIELMRSCGMPRLLETIRELHRASARYLFACWTTLDWSDRSHREHRRLFNAVSRGDAEAACAELGAHIHAAGDALTAALSAGAMGRAAALKHRRRPAAKRGH